MRELSQQKQKMSQNNCLTLRHCAKKFTFSQIRFHNIEKLKNLFFLRRRFFK